MKEISQEEFKFYRNLKQKKCREQQNLFLVEGFRLLKEMQQAKWPVKCILYENEASKLAESFPWENIVLKKGGISMLSEVPSNQKLIGVASFKKLPKQNFSRWRKILILENIADPGNLGTIIRSASAFAFDALFLGKNCTDPFGGKCLRSSMGGIFRIPIYTEQDLIQLFDTLKTHEYEVIGTSPHSKTQLSAHTFQEKTALLLSNEAHGSEFNKQISKWLSIPNPGLESLNVAQAASIFLYAIHQDIPSNPPKKEKTTKE